MPRTRDSDRGPVSDWALVLAARDRFVAAASAAGPDAPTLCAGWTVRHLVGHLLTLRSDPVAWPGIALPHLPATALAATALDAATTDLLWARVQVAARQLHARRRVGLTPLELLVWAHRGDDVAAVRRVDQR